jgi:hypothetical protein
MMSSTSALILVVLCTVQHTSRQLSSSPRDNPTSGWEGRRVVALKGFDDYFAQMEDGETILVKPDGLSVNIVAVVQNVEGDRVWIKSDPGPSNDGLALTGPDRLFNAR